MKGTKDRKSVFNSTVKLISLEITDTSDWFSICKEIPTCHLSRMACRQSAAAVCCSLLQLVAAAPDVPAKKSSRRQSAHAYMLSTRG